MGKTHQPDPRGWPPFLSGLSSQAGGVVGSIPGGGRRRGANPRPEVEIREARLTPATIANTR